MSRPTTKKLKVKAVAPKLKLFRANEPLLSVFMWGINHTINELDHVNQKVMLMPDDFKSYSKIRVDNHMFNKDIMPSHFKVKEYCPLVFKNLRERFGIDDIEYMGSTVDRQANDKEKMKSLPTFKDNDFVNDGLKIHVGEEAKEKIMAIIQKDTEFLAGLHLMDYSLIVDIEEEDEEGEEMTDGYGFSITPPDSPQPITPLPFNGELDPKLEKYAYRCSDACPRREVYFMAMIDILTKYGMKKRTAQAAKTVKHGAGAEISTVKPEQYAKRFLDFLDKYIE
ncbi:hypothetical protein LOTGIDRAFT_169923 [Lottia gigantea]|uniref:PIPK domain-containing protein n=1 Tax=Lottia gigantea TaxID=225164 RepID=V3YWP5_LOTGI|nr:hypothetical protein LOTGIDRAFT_169923 [Lottia gigantea]ESO82453.1 hypothetical protein LOTGIDRAFT_169923 [Lottia gigantea]